VRAIEREIGGLIARERMRHRGTKEEVERD